MKKHIKHIVQYLITDLSGQLIFLGLCLITYLVGDAAPYSVDSMGMSWPNIYLKTPMTSSQLRTSFSLCKI